MKKKMTTFAIGVGLACLPFVSLSYGEQSDYPGLERQSQSGDQMQSSDQNRDSQRFGDQSRESDRDSDSSQMRTSDADKSKAANEGMRSKQAATKPGDTDMTNTKGEVGAVP